MSSRSNYSLYTPYVSGPQSVGGSGTVSGGGGGGSATGTLTRMPNHKEAEVDVLTDLLVQSMDGSADSDTYGIITRLFFCINSIIFLKKSPMLLQEFAYNAATVWWAKVPVARPWNKSITLHASPVVNVKSICRENHFMHSTESRAARPTT